MNTLPTHAAPPLTLGPAAIAQCVLRAALLLHRHPLRWAAAIVVFVFVAELSMLVPWVGLLCKLTVSALLGAQMLALFADADHGRPPRLGRLAGVLCLPAGAQAALVAGSLAPMSIGLAYVGLRHGGTALAAFFAASPATLVTTDLFFEFKMVMLTAALPFVFTGSVVVLGGLSGRRALTTAVIAAARNPGVALLLIGSTVAAEHLLEHLPRWWPGTSGIVLAALWMLSFLAWMLGCTYTLGARVLALHAPAASTAPALGPMTDQGHV